VNVDVELAGLLASCSSSVGYARGVADEALTAWLFARLNQGGVQKIGAEALASAAMRVLLQNKENLAGRENCVFLAGPPSTFKSSLAEELASCLGFTVDAQKSKQQQQQQKPGGGYLYYNFMEDARVVFGPKAQEQLLAQLREAQDWAEKKDGRVVVVVLDEIGCPLTSSPRKRCSFEEAILMPILNNTSGFKASQLIVVMLANVLDQEIADAFGQDTDAQRATKPFGEWKKKCIKALKLRPAVASRLGSCVVCPPPTMELFRRLLAARLVLRFNTFGLKGGEFTSWREFSDTDIHPDLLGAALWDYQPVLGWRDLQRALDPKMDKLLGDGGKVARNTGLCCSELKLGLDNGRIVLRAISEDRRVELARQGEFDSYCRPPCVCVPSVPMCLCGCCLPCLFFHFFVLRVHGSTPRWSPR
jgi:hypothetical protein